MGFQFMTEEWAREVCRAINADEAYRTHARSWNKGPVVLGVEMPEGGVKYARADVAAGECRALTIEDAPDPKAAITLTGRSEVWKDLLVHKSDPTIAIARKQLELKGSWLTLLTYQKAAKALVDVVSSIDTEYP